MDRLAAIVEQLEERLGARDGEPTPLEGGITNRNFRLGLGGRDYVVRLCGKDTEALGIDRGAECLAAARASELGIGPPVAVRLADQDVLVTAFVAGRTADAADLRAPAVLARVAAALRAFHDGPPMTTVFDVPAIVEQQREVVLGRGGAVPDGLDEALATARRIQAALDGPDHEPVPCHNDLLSANFILDGERAAHRRLGVRGDERPLLRPGQLRRQQRAGRRGRAAPARGLLRGSARAGARSRRWRSDRYVSDLREAMWGVVQTVLSDLDFDYRAYAAEHFERLGRTAADPRFEEWMAVAGAA